MRSLNKPLSALVLTLLAACASAPAPQPGILTDIDPIEQVAIDALKLNLAEEARTGLDAALVKYQMLDDLEGQWRIHLINTKLANGNGDHTAANAEVDRLDELAKLINTDFVHYHTDILLGQIKQETRHFQSALGVAATPLQQAVALTYLDRVDEAVAMIDSSEVDHPTDRAFILFRYALSTGDEADLQRALAVYKLAEDSRGVADTLVLLSRRSRQNNDLRSAQIYGRRAIRVLSSMGDLRRADIIEAWLAEL